MLNSDRCSVEQPPSSDTSNCPISIDVSFVKRKLFDHYDDIVSSRAIESLTRVLTTALQTEGILVVACTDAMVLKTESKSAASHGIVEGRTFDSGLIAIIMWDRAVEVFTDGVNFNSAVKYLSATIRHELVHREQLVRSNCLYFDQHPKRYVKYLDEWQEYYSDPHELLAMAHEIAEQLEQVHLCQLSSNQRLLYRSYRYNEFRTSIKGARYEHLHVNRMHKNIYKALSVC